jgi:hypothetical protein
MPDGASAYSVTLADAQALAGIVAVPTSVRADLLRAYRAAHGEAALINLFAQAIGMANSVVENNREAIEILGICDGTLHPHSAHQINLPTMLGACQGAQIARHAKGMCHGCAFRLGSVANQSPSTTLDAGDCVSAGTPFLCHDEPDGKPRRACRGFVTARRRAGAHA